MQPTVSEINSLFESHRVYFRTGATLPLGFRLERLQSLRAMVSTNESILCKALDADMQKPVTEAYVTEIVTVLHEIDFHIKHLKKWIAPQKVGGSLLNFPSRNLVLHRPFGVSLVISAWNYPVNLLLMPLIGAISAGCTAILKPSEIAPATSKVMADLIPQYFDPNYVSVVEGGVDVNTHLLEMPFDKMFFTGSTQVGKIVMSAAARHLSNVTLELGGKSPAIVHRDADLSVALRRIWWGKCLNAGQICVAPDYVLVHNTLKEAFVEKSAEVLDEFYPKGYTPGKNYTRIINQKHFDRIRGLTGGCNVLHGGIFRKDELVIEPTLIDGVDWNHPILQEEIFGPILPILTYSTDEDLFKALHNAPNPLALYLFSSDKHLEKRILHEVPFGGGCINDTIGHLANSNLPFGGVGSSGSGNYHGFNSFAAFSYSKGVMNKPLRPDPSLRYPPYGRKIHWIKRFLK
jgi:aldehyde dehydrogenase (NAD+)